jgi:transposase
VEVGWKIHILVKEPLMSVHPQSPAPVPADTAAAARAAFRRGNPYVAIRDRFGSLFRDTDLLSLYGHAGGPALSPACLATVTLLQYAEGLSDEQAAEMVRSRLDWKYLLGLPLDDPGFDASVLCAFRRRLLQHSADDRLLTLLLEQFKEAGLVKARGTQRTDSLQVVAAVRERTRVELVEETLRVALEALAVAAPAWLAAHADPAWAKRYDPSWAQGRRRTEAEETAHAAQIGQDGQQLLTAIATEQDPRWDWLSKVPACVILARVWAQQYHQPPGGGCRWRTHQELPPEAEQLCSPHDLDARYATHGGRGWTGYAHHVTESVETDPDRPQLILDVTTTVATTPDKRATPQIQDRLAARALPPGRQVLDGGYLTVDTLLAGDDRTIETIGPLAQGISWQGRAGEGFEMEAFTLDWEAKAATCPQGKQSSSWRETTRRETEPIIQVHFRRADCQACPVRERCTQSDRRSIQLLPREKHERRQAALAVQQTAAFKAAYRVRAGIEGTASELIRVLDARHARYRGEAKVRLEGVLLGAAVNVRRIGAWLLGGKRSQTRTPTFVQLLAPAA